MFLENEVITHPLLRRSKAIFMCCKKEVTKTMAVISSLILRILSLLKMEPNLERETLFSATHAELLLNGIFQITKILPSEFVIVSNKKCLRLVFVYRIICTQWCIAKNRTGYTPRYVLLVFWVYL